MEGSQQKSHNSENLIQVSNKKDIKFFLYIARQILINHNDLEITAIGESISNAIIIGETLCRNKQTQWKKITTDTIEPKFIEKEGKEQKNYQRNHRNIKISIKLLKL